MRPQKSMEGIVIDIWEKSNFFRINWITKMYQKRNFSSGGAFKAPLPHVGLTYIFDPATNRVKLSRLMHGFHLHIIF